MTVTAHAGDSLAASVPFTMCCEKKKNKKSYWGGSTIACHNLLPIETFVCIIYILKKKGTQKNQYDS